MPPAIQQKLLVMVCTTAVIAGTTGHSGIVGTRRVGRAAAQLATVAEELDALVGRFALAPAHATIP